MISVQSVSKSFGIQKIFDDVTFSLNQGERAGLVGRNGHGKSTLFRILAGDEHPDGGNVVLPKGYTIGYLNQQLNFTHSTVLAEALCGLPADSHDEEWKVKKILSGLGFQESDFTRPISEFSGGFQMRINLTKALVQDSNLLLLDEPTNFLDIVSIRWFEQFLQQWPGELILVTHDRTFMDRVVHSIIGIHRHTLRKVRGNTDTYYSQIEQEEEVHENRRINEEKKQKQMQEFISKFRAKARQANLVQSRIKTLEKMQTGDKLAAISDMSFSFNAVPFVSKYIIEARDLRFSYTGDAPYLVENLTFAIEAKDTVCIVGRNGRGKSTLLKLIAGALSPVAGSITVHRNAEVAWYAQAHTEKLAPERTVLEEIENAQTDRAAARAIAGAMMFSGDAALKPVKVLSGGEKSRVLLGKLLVQPANLLLLDEPTHHLDMQSVESLIDAVERFDGTSVIVTHDERMLERLANKIVLFHESGVTFFHGTYQDMLQKYPWEDGSMQVIHPDTETEKDDSPAKISKKELRRLKADFNTRKAQTLNPLRATIDKLEEQIAEKEAEHQKCTESLIVLSEQGDGAKISETAKQISDIEHAVSSAYTQLEKAMEEYEHKESEFADEDARLSELS